MQSKRAYDSTVDWVGIGLGGCLLIGLLLHRPHGFSGLTMVQDDFFYYEKIASEIVTGHGSTFNGIVATNGYHPLWMVAVTLLSIFFRSPDSLIPAVYVVVAFSVFATYFFTRRILQTLHGERWLTDLLAASLALLSLRVLRSGMEVVLTVPLALVLFYRLLSPPQNARQSFGTALLAALLILSRLDAAIWVAGLYICLVITQKIARRHWPAIVLGFLPLPAYFAYNKIKFGEFVPISGQAKQLRTAHTLSPAILQIFHMVALQEVLIVLLCLAGIVVFPLAFRRLPANFRVLGVPTLLFPFVYFFVLSILSDWPAWPWYLYAWSIAGIVTLAGVIALAKPPADRIVAGIAALFCVLCAGEFVLQRAPRPAGRVMAGEFLREFSLDHKGIYAMGDRAGVASILMSDPIIQTEGLVMDQNFLTHIRREDPLVPTLRSYGVRYYVANFYGSGIPGGCFIASEPTKAGPTAKHMRSTICDRPVATFSRSDTQIAVYDLAQ
jgi:hypothetical protein